MAKIIFITKLKPIFKFSLKNYLYIVGFIISFKILIISQFRQIFAASQILCVQFLNS